jgi:anti-sigma B factor antagonist
MDITVRTSGDCHILDLNGFLVLGSPTMELRKAVHETVNKNDGKILVNLQNVAYMDVPGLGELVGCYSHAKRQGRKLVLLHPQDRTIRLLIRTKLITVFDIFYDEALAVAGSVQNTVSA